MNLLVTDLVVTHELARNIFQTSHQMIHELYGEELARVIIKVTLETNEAVHLLHQLRNL